MVSLAISFLRFLQKGSSCFFPPLSLPLFASPPFQPIFFLYFHVPFRYALTFAITFELLLFFLVFLFFLAHSLSLLTYASIHVLTHTHTHELALDQTLTPEEPNNSSSTHHTQVWLTSASIYQVIRGRRKTQNEKKKKCFVAASYGLLLVNLVQSYDISYTTRIVYQNSHNWFTRVHACRM